MSIHTIKTLELLRRLRKLMPHLMSRFEGNWALEVMGLSNAFETHTTNVQYSLERSSRSVAHLKTPYKSIYRTHKNGLTIYV